MNTCNRRHHYKLRVFIYLLLIKKHTRGISNVLIFYNYNFYRGKSFFLNVIEPTISPMIPIVARINNFQINAVVPFKIGTTSKKEIIET